VKGGRSSASSTGWADPSPPTSAAPGGRIPRGRRPLQSELLEDGGPAVAGADDDALVAIGDERVRELVASLPPDQRDVLLLRVVADLSIEDTAAALGKKPGAVKSLQHRAAASLRRRLGPEGDQGVSP
jgi:RNA polymerase sigma-70 factor (ECF subfamily)